MAKRKKSRRQKTEPSAVSSVMNHPAAQAMATVLCQALGLPRVPTADEVMVGVRTGLTALQKQVSVNAQSDSSPDSGIPPPVDESDR